MSSDRAPTVDELSKEQLYYFCIASSKGDPKETIAHCDTLPDRQRPADFEPLCVACIRNRYRERFTALSNLPVAKRPYRKQIQAYAILQAIKLCHDDVCQHQADDGLEKLRQVVHSAYSKVLFSGPS